MHFFNYTPYSSNNERDKILIINLFIKLTFYLCIFCYYVAQCPTLSETNPTMITCSLGHDGVPSAGDTCNYTCGTGLVRAEGDITRTCGTNGNWIGTPLICRPSMYQQGICNAEKKIS